MCFVWERRSVGCGRDVCENMKENGGVSQWFGSMGAGPEGKRERAIDGYYERLVGGHNALMQRVRKDLPNSRRSPRPSSTPLICSCMLMFPFL